MIRQKQTSKNPDNGSGRRRNVALLLLALVCLALVQIVAAQSDDPLPAQTPDVEEGANIVDPAPSDAELAAITDPIERYIAAHVLPAGLFEPANLTGSSKSASKETVSPNGVFAYTITIVNSGDFDIPATMTDEEPANVQFMDIDCEAFISDSCQIDGGTAEWSGTVAEGGTVTITIQAKLSGDAEPGEVIENTAQIVSAEQNVNRSAEITVDEIAASPIQFVPLTLYGLQPDPEPVTLTTTLPNSQNSWQLSWTSSQFATGYEIQESNDPNFGAATSTVVGQQTSLVITKQPTFNNVFYYRARSLVGQTASDWSNVISVVGGYRDDFDDPSSGWAVRRGTNRDVLRGFYENGKYVTMITSRWDWLVASPLRPAPRVPYVIDFEARIVSLGYVHSAGAIFGGDWNGETCPPDVSFEQWPRHDDCFNHFYNTNSIYNDTDISNVKIGLLFERVDRLEWRPNDGGSPLKRVGDIASGVRDYRGIKPDDWNHYRIEVRDGSIRVYAGRPGQELQFQYEYDDTRWITSPYFGFFTSTDIIENSTWRFEYMQVMPID